MKIYHVAEELWAVFSTKIQVPSYFDWGYRHLSVLHARIGNIYIIINNYLSINHLSDRTFCGWCIDIEDAKHCFFSCNKF